MSLQRYFDLHCDTITHFESLTADDAAFSLDHLPENAVWAQCCAVFVPDALRGEDAIRYYEHARDTLYREAEQNADRIALCRTAKDVENAFESGRNATILTVESGAALAGDLSRIEKLWNDGVRAMTLVWNGENELGCGQSDPDRGLTDFGRDCIREMEHFGMLVDVSHLSDRGFRDVCETAKRPFIATHSNARAVCPHRRNLTDEQILEIVRRGGLIGLNYCRDFLGGDEPEWFYRHVEHFLALGAEKALALGSDYDGAEIPAYLAGPDRLPALREGLLSRKFSEETVNDLMCGNALRFWNNRF